MSVVALPVGVGPLVLWQVVEDVVGHELDLALVRLKLNRLISGAFLLAALQSKDGVVDDEPEGIVVELAHRQLALLVLGLQVREHVLEHVLLVA